MLQRSQARYRRRLHDPLSWHELDRLCHSSRHGQQHRYGLRQGLCEHDLLCWDRGLTRTHLVASNWLLCRQHGLPRHKQRWLLLRLLLWLLLKLLCWLQHLRLLLQRLMLCRLLLWQLLLLLLELWLRPCAGWCCETCHQSNLALTECRSKGRTPSEADLLQLLLCRFDFAEAKTVSSTEFLHGGSTHNKPALPFGTWPEFACRWS